MKVVKTACKLREEKLLVMNNEIINHIKTAANAEMSKLLEGSNPSAELTDVILYITENLVSEFQTNVITSAYLMMSILDNRNTHANLILESCLMSQNMKELKNVYMQVLEEHKEDFIALGGIIFDNNVANIIKCATKERERSGADMTGTEHILLAIMNKENNFKEADIFEKFNITYDFLYRSCTKINEKSNSPMKRRMRKIPLKSEINVTSVSNGSHEYIDKYTISLSEMIDNGQIDNIIGRDKEINEIIKILSRRKKNNAILVGEGGAGKTAVVYGLAKLMKNGKATSSINGKEIVMLDSTSLVSGTNLRGMFEDRVNNLFNELKNNNRYILFIDDIHTVLKSGNRDKDGDLSGLIGDALTNGDIKFIATTTYKEYRMTVESNSSICRKFQKVIIDPATKEVTYQILKENKEFYEDFHNVTYTDEAIHKAIELADRYITDRRLPDSAFDIIDLAGAKSSVEHDDSDEIKELKEHLADIQAKKEEFLNNGQFEMIDDCNEEEDAIKIRMTDLKRAESKEETDACLIDTDEIAAVVSEITNIPIQRLSMNEKERIANMDASLKKSVVGQDEAVESVCRVIKRNKVGLGNSEKPLGTLLLLGPSGVGKTLVAKKLAEEVFGDENALVRIDMSEYSDKTSVTKLTGSNPGYVGFENGGLLTEAVKHKQYCVLLLDEIEKADDQVHNMFLQLFDEGRLTDSAGQTINFKNVIILMTSNVGAKNAAEMGPGIGFQKDEDVNRKEIIDKELKKKFTPEFLNRIDKIVYFNSLNDDNLKDIVNIELNKFKNRLTNLKYDIKYSDDVITYIHAKAVEKKDFGARPIIRLVQDNIEDQVTDLMLSHDYPQNYTFSASCKDSKIVIN